MPSFKHISVDIVTPAGSLPALHQESTYTHPLCESYILSKTDCPFWVSITPDKDAFARKESSRSTTHRTTNDSVIDLTQDDQELTDYDDVMKAEEEEWHLLAEVFLDSRSTPETSAIVYIPWDGYVKERVLRGRIATTKDGHPVEKPWLFKDVSLEGFLEALSVAENDADGDLAIIDARDPSGGDPSEDILVQGIQKLGNKGKEKENHHGEIGQIKIVLQKIIITGYCIDIDYVPDLVDNDEPMQVGKSVRDVSHTTGFGKPNDIHFSATRKSYRPYPMESEPYATFIFHYRGEKQMRKLGFLDASEASHRKLDKLIPFLTPLPTSGGHKASKPWEKFKTRFRPSGPVSSTTDEESEKQVASGSDQALKKSRSETSKSGKGQNVTKESSSSERSRDSSGSSDKQDSEAAAAPAPRIAETASPYSLADPEHKVDIELIISAAAKSIISPPKNLPPREDCPRDLRSDETTDASESDTGYEGDTETPKMAKERRKKNSQEEAEEVKELTQKLHLVQLKRSHSDETDDEDDQTSGEEREGRVKRYGKAKRVRRHKDAISSMEAEEYMSEAKED